MHLHGPSHLDIYEENEDENLREMCGGRGVGCGVWEGSRENELSCLNAMRLFKHNVILQHKHNVQT